MNKMSVIQFNESFPPIMDGVANVTRNYAYWIKKKYGKAYVVTPEYPGFVDEEIFPVLRYPSLPLVLRKPYRVGLNVHNPALWKKLKNLQADLVHAQSPFSSGNIALQYARQKKVPLVATFHSKFYDDFKEVTRSDAISWIMTHLVVDFFNYADAVWAVNQSTKETLISYGYRGHVDVVPNGADFTMPEDPLALSAQVDTKLHLAKDEPVLLFVGQMIRQKNIGTILNAMKILNEKNKPFTLLLVGEGKSKEEFEEQVRDHRLGKRVRFLGKILDRELLKGIFGRADLFIFPSLYDNAPVVTREAAAMGTPSVIVRGSNAAEGIRDGENGFLCDNSPESLALTIERALRDPDKLKAAGSEAQRSVFLSWESVIDNIVVPKYQQIIQEFKG
ncbi:MAG: glycosyltransferase [Candidatus Marinimicrobia bacterium]|jgi:glycosyltransferase involved in cell wall biosynthesis|nr:glycosyltransferase [Candidatus Neomarinimicrobiota bacterium]MDD4960711.1 glycosyltransferase [Candidatus Neomarinimicrobiota bacterium]MDD5709738.1 glycosyltransferase [Candidatus Neomarinimicrobiota bacterium]MDX9777127.1 glycosyltransferase [bacterium]